MEQKSIILNFPKTVIEQPVMSRVIKKFDVDINILQANISREEDGYMFAIIKGEPKSIKDSLDYIASLGIQIKLPKEGVIRDEAKCTHCGACTVHCIPQALAINTDTYKVSLDIEKCINCKLCLSACSYGAVSIGRF